MRATSKVGAPMVAVLVVAMPLVAGVDPGRDPSPGTPARSARGGGLARTPHYQFEVFFYATGLRIFVTDPAGAAMSASALTGTATFYHPNSPQPWFAQPLHPAPAQPGSPAESLDLAMDLRSVPTSGVTVTMEVHGLPDPREPAATFTMPFARVDVEAASPHGAQTYGATTEVVHYYPIAGFYRTASGVLIWVPTPGYYYGAPVQYYPHTQAGGWQAAQPAAGPGRVAAATRSTGAPESINPELYWRPRAMGDTDSYQAWLHGVMWRQRLAGRSPSGMDGECVRCHR